MPGPLQPGFTPPGWPRLGARRDAVKPPPGGIPSDPAQIPLCWLSRPVAMRLDKPANHAEVSTTGGVTARADNTTSITAARGVYPFAATLTTDVAADAANLAHWTVTYYGTPRMRIPSMTIDLLYRTDAERQFLLTLPIGRRVQVTGVPPEWPAGANHLVIVGITHQITMAQRRITFTLNPIVGAAPGVPGPWFRWSSSSWSGTDARPF